MPNINTISHEFAAAFAGRLGDARPICFPDELRREALDLSLESLEHVDDYLLYLNSRKTELLDEEWNSTVLYGGAYVGEVIRSETGNRFHWIDYDDYMPDHPDLQSLIPERSTSTCAFLVDDNNSMAMPLNKIARYIDDGEENSVHFFARCDIAKTNDA